jgi:exosortase family protein XrtF
MVLNTYLQKWKQIPYAVKQFLLRGLTFFIVWKLIYLCFLVPGRILDSPLTRAVGVITADGLNFFTHSHNYWSTSETDTGFNNKSEVNQAVYFQKQNLVGIYDACNALELFVLYAGFIVCMPATIKRKFIFIAGGVSLIFIVNILRCIVVAYVVEYYPQNADFIHHYLFVFVVYALIVALWLFFVGKIDVTSNAS